MCTVSSPVQSRPCDVHLVTTTPRGKQNSGPPGTRQKALVYSCNYFLLATNYDSRYDNTHEHATAQAHAVSLLCRHHAAQGGRDRRSPARQTRCHARRQRRSPGAGSCTPSSPPRQRTWPRDASGSACRSRLSKLGCPLPERSLEFPNWFPSTQILKHSLSFCSLPLVIISKVEPSHPKVEPYSYGTPVNVRQRCRGMGYTAPKRPYAITPKYHLAIHA